MTKPSMEILLAATRGFCAGVERAIHAAEHTLARSPTRSVYVRHAIVHNDQVLQSLADQGIRFVEQLAEVPKAATVVFSAHGVGTSVEEEARQRGLKVVDATCPLVRRVHHEAERHTAAGRLLIIIGHADHVEVAGIVGRCRGPVVVVESLAEAESLTVPDPARLAYVVQTTLAVDEARQIIDLLRGRFPEIAGPGTRTICYATQNRQNAVAQLCRNVRRVIVCGDAASSNSNRLREQAEAAGCRAILVAGVDQLPWQFLDGEPAVGLTAGASVPETIVQEMIARIGERFEVTVREIGAHERSPRLHPVDFGALGELADP